VRILGGVLAALIVLVQYPLWLGKGGWLRVWEVDRQLEAQHGRNQQLQVRNQSLEAEVLDLKQGVDALEERARYELGMIKSNEVFFQIVDKSRAQAPGAAPPKGR
jgi:cell division protein FtsB